MLKEKRSTRGVLRSEVEVKSWAARRPLVGEVRPGRCPDCGFASGPIGSDLGLHGHGLRSRQLLGPMAPGAEPMAAEIEVRRYRCRNCKAVMTVGPAGTMTSRLYSAAAIAWALALYGLSALPPASVRALISPWRVTGHEAVRRWRTLARWCRTAAGGRLFARVPALEGTTLRAVAGAAATAVSAFAVPLPEPPPLDVLAFHGAARAA